MKASVLLASALLVIGASTAANAYDYRQAQIDARRAEEAYRIRHGRATGELTLLEKWRLQGEQRRITAMERNALRDGYIDPSEAYRINRALDRASGNIYRETHDSQKAWWRRW